MNSTKLTIKDSSLSFMIGFLLCQIGVVAFTIITLIVCNYLNISTNSLSIFFNTAIGYLITNLIMYLIMLCVFFFFNRNKQNKITQKINPKKLLLYVSIAILSFLSLYPIVTCIDSLLIKLGAKINTIPFELNTKNYLISIIPFTVLPAICEELLFRGLIFKGLKKHGKIFSITISALMFSIFHMAISQTVYPLLMGLLFSVIMFYEDNIYYCIAMHFTNNFIALTLSYLKTSLVFNHWTYILLSIILLIAFLCVIIYFILRNNKKMEKEFIDTKNKIYLATSLIVMMLFWILVNFI